MTSKTVTGVPQSRPRLTVLGGAGPFPILSTGTPLRAARRSRSAPADGHPPGTQAIVCRRTAGADNSRLVGSGNIGSTVARLAMDAGYDVVLSN